MDCFNETVPFIILNGRKIISQEQAEDDADISNFVKAFPKCFQRLREFHGWEFFENGIPNESGRGRK